ncbi:MAG: DUF3990 domain-containing protein [Clostridiales Family XIII bacterium]|jgi:hypothetical protein|nr:DUF3990 domain-containing protein [Clostridiales Family XIII bacterium]
MTKTLYHGSRTILETPIPEKGNRHSDFGSGFYCTESLARAKEWACDDARGGFVNTYSLSTEGLKILDLTAPPFGLLYWLALLAEHRIFRLTTRDASQGREYLRANFLPAPEEYDAIIGYRADDSYFAFAQDFLDNAITYKQLIQALSFGKSCEQFVLKSPKAFAALHYEYSDFVDGNTFFEMRKSRDVEMRSRYSEKRRENDADAKKRYYSAARFALPDADAVYLTDITRKEMWQGDERLR